MFFQVLTKFGFLAQLVEAPNYYPGGMGSNPVETLIFFQACFMHDTSLVVSI